MISFNPDGSIKLTEHSAKKKKAEDHRMQVGRCMKLRKDLVHERAPKKCVLSITLSSRFTDTRFMEGIHSQFKQYVETPTSITKINDKEFTIEIGSNFRRCSDCTALVGKYREFLDGNLIEDHGTCTLKKRDFCYEDYFE